jgi:hypothetical protein
VTQSRLPRPFRCSLFWPARAPQVPPFRVGSRGTLSKKTTFPGSPAPWGGELHSFDCLGRVSNFNASRKLFAKTPNFHAIGLGFTSMKRGKCPFSTPLMKIVGRQKIFQWCKAVFRFLFFLNQKSHHWPYFGPPRDPPLLFRQCIYFIRASLRRDG